MYIFERAFSVITFMLILFIICGLIYKSRTQKQLKKYLIAYLVILCLLAYYYIPASTADLTRYTLEAQIYANSSLYKLNQLIIQSASPMRIIYLYILGKIGNDHLIPCITAFLYYGCMFIVFYKMAKKYDLSSKSLSISLFFFMSMGQFLLVISSIRTTLSFALILLCVYNELIEGTPMHKNIVLYLIAALFHPAALALIILRLVFTLFQKDKLWLKVINLIFVILMIVVIKKYGNIYTEIIGEKANTYLSGNVFSYFWEYLIGWIFMIFSLLSLLIFKKDIYVDNRIKNFVNFYFIVSLFVLYFGYEYTIFIRYETYLTMMFLPIFALILTKSYTHIRYMKVYKFLLFMVMFSIFIISSVRGDICGYKFFILG